MKLWFMIFSDGNSVDNVYMIGKALPDTVVSRARESGNWTDLTLYL